MTPLVPHPSTPESAFGVAAGVERVAGDGLRFTYRIVGSLRDVRVPVEAPSARRDRLWEHTCFEAFVQVDGEASYVELNFAPSTEWAVYGFARYREGTPPPAVVPAVAVARGAESLDVTATVALGRAGAIRVGLTAVVESTAGRLTYWALTHPSPAPDFHRADGFVARVGEGA
jgi:hypothetical protein